MMNRIKAIAKKILPGNLKVLLSEINQAYLLPHKNFSYSQEGEDIVLKRFFDKQESGFYVDVGAHHPIRFSNTYLFYKKGWHGINIDAMPGSMRAFKRWRKRDINLETPVALTNGELTCYSFNEPALNTFSKELAGQMESLPDYHLIKTEKLVTMPLSTILDTHLPSGQNIDFMSIDVEGLDLDVLKSNNWNKYRPRFLLVEQLEFSINNLSKDETYNFVTGLNYDLVARTYNTSFFIDNTTR